MLYIVLCVFQGDELMRLPSHSYDKNDLVRSLSLPADGPEEVIEADDYLQPQADSLAQGDSLPRVKVTTHTLNTCSDSLPRVKVTTH